MKLCWVDLISGTTDYKSHTCVLHPLLQNYTHLMRAASIIVSISHGCTCIHVLQSKETLCVSKHKAQEQRTDLNKPNFTSTWPDPIFIFLFNRIFIKRPFKVVYSEALTALAYYDVKCRYEWIFSVSAKIKHSKLKESPKADPRTHVEPTNRFSAERWYGCSESLW